MNVGATLKVSLTALAGACILTSCVTFPTTTRLTSNKAGTYHNRIDRVLLVSHLRASGIYSGELSDAIDSSISFGIYTRGIQVRTYTVDPLALNHDSFYELYQEFEPTQSLVIRHQRGTVWDYGGLKNATISAELIDNTITATVWKAEVFFNPGTQGTKEQADSIARTLIDDMKLKGFL